MIDAGPHEASLPTDLEVEEKVLAKYDGEPQPNPFLRQLVCTPTLKLVVRASETWSGRSKNQGYQQAWKLNRISEIKYWKLGLRN